MALGQDAAPAAPLRDQSAKFVEIEAGLSNAIDLLTLVNQRCLDVTLQHGPLLASLFFTGLIGSLSHCGVMCGPFVVMQSEARLIAQPASPSTDFRRLRDAALLPYQLGRATTYMTLGAVAAWPVARAHFALDLSWLSPSLLVFVGLFLAFRAATGIGLRLPRFRRRQQQLSAPRPKRQAPGLGLRRMITAIMRPLARQPWGWRGYCLGLCLGFLPCGLLYAAIVMAASAREPLSAALGMSLFALGTFPVSWLLGYGSSLVGSRWRLKLAPLLPALTALNAVFILGLAYRSL